MKKITLMALGVFISMLAFVGTASALDTTVGLKGGTLGAGIEITSTTGVEDLRVRAEFNGLNYSDNRTVNTVAYNTKLKLQNIGLIADYHSFSGTFRMSAGAYYNNNKLTLNGVPQGGSYIINGTTYTSAQVGTLSSEAKFNKFSPYVGIGWTGEFSDSVPVGISFDIGALYQGSPKITMQATGTAAGLAADVAAARLKLVADIDKYKWYPVVALGIHYRF